MERKKNVFDRIRQRTKPEDKVFVDLSIDISEQVRYLLKNNKSIKTQKALADILGKEESEVSKWLSGLHNLTLESISKLTVALGKDIIMTDLKAKEKYLHKKPNYEFMNLALEMAFLSISQDTNGATDVNCNFETTSGNNNTIPILPQKATA